MDWRRLTVPKLALASWCWQAGAGQLVLECLASFRRLGGQSQPDAAIIGLCRIDERMAPFQHPAR